MVIIAELVFFGGLTLNTFLSCIPWPTLTAYYGGIIILLVCISQYLSINHATVLVHTHKSGPRPHSQEGIGSGVFSWSYAPIT